MHDYDNIPVLDWNDDHAAAKARAQILRQEPVVLQMPDDFETELEGEAFSCKQQDPSGVLYDCDGGKLLSRLARANHLTELQALADACAQSSSQVDLDRAGKRLIVHD